MELRAPDPVELVADPSEIEIIFNNLVSNAVKYNRDGGSVTVAVPRGDDGAVEDPRGRHRHRLDPRGEPPSSSPSSCASRTRTRSRSWAAAWGCRTVRKLAQLYGGDATVQSEKHVGSTFTVTLSDARPEQLRPPAAPPRAGSRRLSPGSAD